MSAPAPFVGILSVRPPHVDRLLDGTKTIELRRTAWRVPAGSAMLLYASGAGRRQLVGSIKVEGTVIAPVESVWRRFGRHAAVSCEEFDRYFSGTSTAVAIAVRDPRPLREPINLDELRRRHPPFIAPQSFRYVHGPELSRILDGERRELL